MGAETEVGAAEEGRRGDKRGRRRCEREGKYILGRRLTRGARGEVVGVRVAAAAVETA